MSAEGPKSGLNPHENMESVQRPPAARSAAGVFLSAALMVLSLDGRIGPYTVWICLVPLLLTLRSLKPLAGAAAGLLFGFSCWLCAVWWIRIGAESWIAVSGPAAWLLTVLFCLYHAVPYGLYGLSGNYLFRSAGQAPLLKALLLTVLVSVYPAIFPASPANYLYTQPLLIQAADLGGMPLLLFLVALSNELIAVIIVRLREGKGRLRPVMAFVCLTVFVLSYGAYRLHEQTDLENRAASGTALQVLSIQTNFPVNGDVFAMTARGGDFDRATAFTIEQARKHPDAELVIWPEIPLPLSCNTSGCRDRSPLCRMDRPFLFECTDEDRTGTGKSQGAVPSYNGAVLLDPAGPRRTPYRKMLLFPFAEYLPFEDALPALKNFFPGASRFCPGEEPVVFDMGRGRVVAPSLCYETLFSAAVRDAVRRGGNVVVNMVDDAWFGRTRAAEFHLALTLFRAVENRVPMARVANSGPGVFIKASGEMIPETLTAPHVRTASAGGLYPPPKRSPYFYTGDAFLWCAGLYVLWMIARRRRPSRSPSEGISRHRGK